MCFHVLLRCILASKLLAYWDELKIKSGEDILAELGVETLDQRVDLGMVDTWLTEQLMIASEEIR